MTKRVQILRLLIPLLGGLVALGVFPTVQMGSQRLVSHLPAGYIFLEAALWLFILLWVCDLALWLTARFHSPQPQNAVLANSAPEAKLS